MKTMKDSIGHPNATGPGLVNQGLLFREVLPRLYRGTVDEFMRELFLNSLRAQANTAEITVLAPGHFTYRDNGTGIVGGLRGLFNVLCIANSDYEDAAVEPNQRPLGMGFYALLMHAKVKQVRIESATIAFAIDTRRWREDEAYRASWVERVEKRPPTATTGFFLLVEGDESLTDEVAGHLLQPNPDPCNYWLHGATFGPARGYSGLLSITLNGEPVQTCLPSWFVLASAEISDQFEGNLIRIALSESDHKVPAPSEFTVSFDDRYPSSDGDRAGLRLLWFGQPLTDRGISSVRVFLDVRVGAPLTTLAPTRQALVEDGKLAALYNWVKERVFRYVCREVAVPSAAQVKLLYRLDEARAERECPWVLLQPWGGLPPQPAASQEQQIGSFYDLQALTLGHERVLGRETLQSLLLLEDQIVVVLPGTHPVFNEQGTCKLPEGANADPRPFTFQYGLPSFIAALDLQAYKPQLGVRPNGVLWWRPGSPVNEYYACELGWWGIGKEDEPPKEWQQVPPESLLYVHDDIDSWRIENVRFFLGAASMREVILFLEHYAHAFWSMDDEDGEESEEAFDGSVDDLIRELMGDTIASQLVRNLLGAVAPFFGGQGQARHISTVGVLRAEGGGLEGIRVRLHSGETKELKVY